MLSNAYEGIRKEPPIFLCIFFLYVEEAMHFQFETTNQSRIWCFAWEYGSYITL